MRHIAAEIRISVRWCRRFSAEQALPTFLLARWEAGLFGQGGA